MSTLHPRDGLRKDINRGVPLTAGCVGVQVGFQGGRRIDTPGPLPVGGPYISGWVQRPEF